MYKAENILLGRDETLKYIVPTYRLVIVRTFQFLDYKVLKVPFFISVNLIFFSHDENYVDYKLFTSRYIEYKYLLYIQVRSSNGGS